MNICTVCPCCSNKMVRHIAHHREFWFCRNCWQEMPDLSIATEKNTPVKSQLINLSVSSVKLDRALTV
ncbi:MAG: hypothetical protein AB4368_24995 [Xenococcaceae cyanobacterium]